MLKNLIGYNGKTTDYLCRSLLLKLYYKLATRVFVLINTYPSRYHLALGTGKIKYLLIKCTTPESYPCEKSDCLAATEVKKYFTILQILCISTFSILHFKKNI